MTEALVADWLTPDWNIPGVRAFVSTRAGQISQPPYDGFNTADHVGDRFESVQQNRQRLQRYFQWQSEPQWLKQVHGIDVVEAQSDGRLRQGDAVFTRQPGQICALHTADCLPVFFAAEKGAVVGLAHAGWRGLAEGVLEATISAMQVSTERLSVWLGPAIGQAAFEVGDDVRDIFLAHNPLAAEHFKINERRRWQCDLYGLARQRLGTLGVNHISGGGYCTFNESRFFSYRREPVTGRLLSLIWMSQDPDTAQ